MAQLAQAAAVAALGWRLAPNLPLAMTAQAMAFVALNRVRQPPESRSLAPQRNIERKTLGRQFNKDSRRTTTGGVMAAGLVRC